MTYKHIFTYHATGTKNMQVPVGAASLIKWKYLVCFQVLFTFFSFYKHENAAQDNPNLNKWPTHKRAIVGFAPTENSLACSMQKK